MSNLYPVEVQEGEFQLFTKDHASPMTHAIATEMQWQRWRNQTPFWERAKIVGELMKAQRLPPGFVQAPSGQAAMRGPTQGTFQRLGNAVDYARWALMGDNRAFFPPGYSLAPQAPREAAGRRWDYPFWYNLQIPPRSYEAVSFDILRTVADTYDLVRSVIESCKNKVSFQEWDIVPSDPDVSTPSSGTKDRIRWLRNFYRFPDLKRDFSSWVREGLEDMLTIDAMTLYSKPTLSGDPNSLKWIDGGTIAVKLDYWGDEPDVPETAYQQVIKGLPAIDYGDNELFYLPFNRRTHKAYGYSPVEQILITINMALQRQMWQLEWYRSGAQSTYMLCAPPEWNREQMDDFGNWYNNLFYNNPAARHRAVIVPYGSKPMEPKQIHLKDEQDDWLATLVCYAFSMDRSQLIKAMNRASAEHGGDAANKEGFLPFSRFFESSINRVNHSIFPGGWDDVKFTWADSEDLLNPDKAKAYETYCNIGAMTINEVRDDLGLEAIPGGDQSAIGANFTLVQLDENNKLSQQNAQKDQLQQAQVEAAKSGLQKPVGTGPGGSGASQGGSGSKGAGGGTKPDRKGGGGAVRKVSFWKGYDGSELGTEAARLISYTEDYGEEPEPGETLRFVEDDPRTIFQDTVREVDEREAAAEEWRKQQPGQIETVGKGFDVVPSPTAGPQPFGGNKRSRTMMHARGVKLHKRSLKKKTKILRTATVEHRTNGDRTLAKLKETVHNIFGSRAVQVAAGVIADRHLAKSLDVEGSLQSITGQNTGVKAGVAGSNPVPLTKAASFEEGGWGSPAEVTPSLKTKLMVRNLMRQGWEVLPHEVAPILREAADDAALQVVSTAGIVIDQEHWNAIDDEVADLALDRAGELVGMRYDKETGDWIENPNAEWRIDEDVRDEISRLVSYAEQEGWSNAQLRGAILESNLFSESRADMVARTELKYIDGIAARTVAGRTGATQKKWLLSADHKDDDECDENEGEDWIGIDDEFSSGDDQAPAHPNCMCVTTYGWENEEE